MNAAAHGLVRRAIAARRPPANSTLSIDLDEKRISRSPSDIHISKRSIVMRIRTRVSFSKFEETAVRELE